MQELYQLLDQITEFSQPLYFSHKTLTLVSFSIAAHTLFLLLGERDETLPSLLFFCLLLCSHAPFKHLVTISSHGLHPTSAKLKPVNQQSQRRHACLKWSVQNRLILADSICYYGSVLFLHITHLILDPFQVSLG